MRSNIRAEHNTNEIEHVVFRIDLERFAKTLLERGLPSRAKFLDVFVIMLVYRIVLFLETNMRRTISELLNEMFIQVLVLFIVHIHDVAVGTAECETLQRVTTCFEAQSMHVAASYEVGVPYRKVSFVRLRIRIVRRKTGEIF